MSADGHQAARLVRVVPRSTTPYVEVLPPEVTTPRGAKSLRAYSAGGDDTTLSIGRGM